MRVRKRKKRLFRLFILLFFIFLGGTSYLFVKNYREYQQVMVLEEKVSQKVTEYGLDSYKEIILSMIYTESKGLGDDPMQSSESAYGEAGKMMVAEDSIQQGVEYFAQALILGQENGVDLWTAVQAYNFGLDYIYYIAENGGINTVDLADQYSGDILAPQLGNTTHTRYRYWHTSALLHNGGYLYHNGGNMFYAEKVRWNQQKIMFFQELEKIIS